MFIDNRKLKELGGNIAKSFSKVRQEMDNHLDSINENTNEIQSNYEYMCELDGKMDKLGERIDEIQYVLESLMGRGAQKEEEYTVSSKLSIHEQEFFLRLYTLSDKETLTLAEMARRMGFTHKMAENHIKTLKKKGIPVKRVAVGDKIGYFLDKCFKDQQARRSLVKIDERLVKKVNL